eukprot:2941464-Amphidinium_carterae.2
MSVHSSRNEILTWLAACRTQVSHWRMTSSSWLTWIRTVKRRTVGTIQPLWEFTKDELPTQMTTCRSNYVP